MRLLISGSKKNTNTIGSFFIRNFNGSFSYQVLDFPDRFSDLLNSKLYRLIYRFFPVLLIRRMDRLFLNQVDAFKPTIVLIFKGMEISKESLLRVRDRGVKLINYNFDHPFNFFSRGTGNRFVREAIPFYDLHISYSSFIAAELQKKFRIQTAWIPFGFHLTEEQYNLVLAENRPEINRVCFVGNPDALRVEMLRKLVQKGLPIDLYGFGWEKHFETGEQLIIHPPRKPASYWSDPLEFWKVLRQYRVQLNFFRPHNEGSHNLRTFEVPAVGGILLTPASSEQEDFFVPGREIFFYNGFDELYNQCIFLINSDEDLMLEVRNRARLKSVTMDYSYERRTKDLLNLLQKL